ncbi:hypothetical protein EYF80_035897 [Liparis tanakae]|uniref:Uncharacterized protein n=1 Tax=Liparis tanakae TaxID=230148 RepID=A0A4Z2GL26_9TELE|nr:hypothetical protein EYF80_035897 [Liparis tanakae]
MLRAIWERAIKTRQNSTTRTVLKNPMNTDIIGFTPADATPTWVTAVGGWDRLRGAPLREGAWPLVTPETPQSRRERNPDLAEQIAS